MYVVLDADALYLVQKDPSVVKGYEKAVLTPNLVEFKRLCEAMKIPANEPPSNLAWLLSQSLEGVTILQKGEDDIIAYATRKEGEATRVDIPGGLKRCGGQGDILSGVVGTILAWGKNYEDGVYGKEPRVSSSRIPFLAAIGGSLITRTTSRIAFAKHGRAVVTQDMLPEIGPAFLQVFEKDYDSSTALLGRHPQAEL